MYDVFTDRYEFVDKQSYLYLKLTKFMMLFTKEQIKHQQKPKQKKQENLVEEAFRIMHKRFRENLLLEELSQELGVQQRELSEQIVAYTGIDFTAVLNEFRLRNVAVLLALKIPLLIMLWKIQIFNQSKTSITSSVSEQT